MPDNKKDEYKAQYSDEQIFCLFGIGTGDSAMRDFIHGQRLINGSLYVAIDKILDHLLKANPDDQDLKYAKERNAKVPGRPPACDPGDGS